MFVSKLLNKMFFNTNNDCFTTTLSNINQFMLTKDVMNNRIALENDQSQNTSIDSISSIGDTNLLQRKNDFQQFQNETRCITPTPFVSQPVTPDNTFRPIVISEICPENVVVEDQHTSVTLNNDVVVTPFSGAYAPKQQDTLFWCIYIIANGYGEYINVDRNYGVKELEIKKKIADFIQVNGSKMKETNYKITKAAVQEIMSEFLTSQKETNFQCLLALCVYYKINVVIVHNNGKLMLEFLSNHDEETPYYVLKKDSYDKYRVDTDKKSLKDIQEMKTRLVCLVNYMKPIKAASHYKMEDLEALADKLGVLDLTKKYKKAELYQIVIGSTNWSEERSSSTTKSFR